MGVRGGAVIAGVAGLMLGTMASVVGPVVSQATAEPAENVVGLTLAGQLVRFRTDAPSQLSGPVTVAGLAEDERLVAIDYRPATARLYGLGSAGRLYRVDPLSGQTTRVGIGQVPMRVTAVPGADFDPASDRFRVVDTEEQNVRVHPNTGEVVDTDPSSPGVQTDGPLRYAESDQNFGALDPDVAALANSDNTVGAGASTTYAIDANLGVLDRLGSVGGSPISPNSGLLFTVGRLGVETSEAGTAFDITPTGIGYAALTPSSATSSQFARIDLDSGQATIVGPVTGAVLRDIAVSVPDPIRRLAGADRIATAVAVSAHGFPAAGSARAVTLARADVAADALAGAPLAVATRGPLLLSASTSLSPATRAEIERVLVSGAVVHVLGGPQALDPSIDDELRSIGFTVVRYAGSDRYDTSVRIARVGLSDPGTLLLATGLDFPAALVAGPAAARSGGAVLLTAGDRLTPGTRAYLTTRAGATRYAIGRQAQAADPDATRVGQSDDAYELSREVAERFIPGSPLVIGLASGATFPDGLSGGADIGRQGGPLLLVQPDQLPGAVQVYLQSRRATIGTGFLYGGPAAVIESVRLAAQTAIT